MFYRSISTQAPFTGSFISFWLRMFKLMKITRYSRKLQNKQLSEPWLETVLFHFQGHNLNSLTGFTPNQQNNNLPIQQNDTLLLLF